MKLYVLLREVDLGDHVIGVYDSQNTVETAIKLATEVFFGKHNFKPRLYVEEFELNDMKNSQHFLTFKEIYKR